jgi:hypothetical protein
VVGGCYQFYYIRLASYYIFWRIMVMASQYRYSNDLYSVCVAQKSIRLYDIARACKFTNTVAGNGVGIDLFIARLLVAESKQQQKARQGHI